MSRENECSHRKIPEWISDYRLMDQFMSLEWVMKLMGEGFLVIMLGTSILHCEFIQINKALLGFSISCPVETAVIAILLVHNPSFLLFFRGVSEDRRMCLVSC